MKSLSPQEVEILKHELYNLGLNLHVLKDEILDHWCCLVEVRMNDNSSFEEAMQHVLNTYNEKEILKTQKQTKRVHRMYEIKRKMKSVTAVAAVFMLLMVAGADAQNKPEGHPIDGEAEVSSNFGKRKDPFSNTYKIHSGIDIKAKLGTPVVATGNGKVISVEENPKTWGKRIIIAHGDEYQTVFCHLSEFRVKEGEIVKKGEVIGLVGNTGKSTAPHLHYEILKNGEKVNPALYMRTSK